MFLRKTVKNNQKQLQHIAKAIAMNSLTKECSILRDTMGTVGEICVLEKYSPKREKMLDKLTQNVEGTFDPDEQQATKLDKLCVTRWTICVNCLKNIIDNYKPLLKLWKKSLEEKLDVETKSRIIGCKKQMVSFKFYFELQLGRSYMQTPIIFPKPCNRKRCLQ